jgi:hypothetical protein
MVEKRAYTQADFSLGVTVPELIDADDLEIRSQSLQDGKNLRITRGRSARSRPGTDLKVNVGNNQEVHDMRVQSASGELRFAVVVEPGGIRIWDEDYAFVQAFTGAPWGSFPDGFPWVAQFENAMVFGGYEFYALEYDEGTWTFGALSFADLPGGEKALPYWVFERGVTLTPSDYTGTITVTASSSIFSSDWIGKRIRYSKREIVLTAFISGTQMTGTVTERLPPTFTLTFADAAAIEGYAIGHVVTASDTNWSGIVVAKGATTITCVTVLGDAATATFNGPTTSDEIVSPTSTSSPTGVAKESTPSGTTVWDEQLWSDHRGWPQSGTEVNGRFALCNFPRVPNLLCLSSVRQFSDFGTGAADDDAILRTAGNQNPRFLHIVNATDLVILADRGAYYVKTRDGELVTPSNFQVTQFDERGATEVKPVVVEGAVLFVERNKSGVAACVLSGNVYLNWTVLDLARFHAHLVRDPVALCGPTPDPDMSERYVMVVNADGTMATMSWYTSFGEELVGFVPWEMEGRTVERAFPLFDRYHVVVKNGANYTLEVFNPATYVDGNLPAAGAVNGGFLQTEGGNLITTDGGDEIRLTTARYAHLAGQQVKAWQDYETTLTETLDGSGEFSTVATLTAAQVGTPIDARGTLWPREVLESPRRGMIKARVIRVAIAVRETVSVGFVRNSTTTITPARRPSDSVSEPPPLKTDWYRFNVFGNRAHPDMEFFLPEPNPLEITSIVQEVQA